jgi:hypothetical protein
MRWLFVAPICACFAGSTQAYAKGVTYFPPAFAKPTVTCSFGGRRATSIAVVSDIEHDWYSAQLTAAHEPSLYLESKRLRGGLGNTLRFTWLRTFHPPVIVRLEGLGSKSPRLIAKQLSGAGGYAPGTVSKTLERPLSREEARSVEKALGRSDALNIATRLCDMSLDGAQWIIEEVDANGYHFVDRFSPVSGGVRDLGLTLLKLTGWEFKPIY